MRVALCAILALTAPAGSFAQSVAQPPVPRMDLSGFDGAPGDLAAAIGRIEAAGSGRVLDARFQQQAGTPGFDVVVAKDGRVRFSRFTKVAPGLVAVASQSQPPWMLGWQSRKDIALVRQAKISLGYAIRKAEASTSGAPAVAAGIAVSASSATTDVHAYNMLLKTGDSIKRVAVDSETGLIITNPSAFSGLPVSRTAREPAADWSLTVHPAVARRSEHVPACRASQDMSPRSRGHASHGGWTPKSSMAPKRISYDRPKDGTSRRPHVGG